MRNIVRSKGFGIAALVAANIAIASLLINAREAAASGNAAVMGGNKRCTGIGMCSGLCAPVDCNCWINADCL